MREIDVFCVFPSVVDAAMRVGVVGRAIERGEVSYRSFDLKEYAPGGRVDDMPFGGGAGMVVRVDVVARALEAVYGAPAGEVRQGRRVVLTEAWGRPIDQLYVNEVASGPDLTIVCGRYGGVDERVATLLATEVISLGGFVLSGGEIAASALADATIRRLEGVLGNSESLLGESFAERDVIGPPQYTRPAVWEGTMVPEVLLSGNHALINTWRKERAFLRAARRQP